MNLLKLPEYFPTGKKFNEMFLNIKKNKKTGEITYTPKNIRLFKKMIKGFVSYYRGAPPVAFPKKNFIVKSE